MPSWIVDYTRENLDVWEPQAVYGPFRSEADAKKFALKMIARSGFDWGRDSLDVREVTRPSDA
jgi:hypothetical protein